MHGRSELTYQARNSEMQEWASWQVQVAGTSLKVADAMKWWQFTSAVDVSGLYPEKLRKIKYENVL